MPASQKSTDPTNDKGFIGTVFGITALTVALWAGGVLASLVTGRGLPKAGLVSGIRTLASPGHPSRGWRTTMPGPVAYWTATALVVTVLGVLAAAATTWWSRDGRRRGDVHSLDGLATRGEVKAAASSRALLRRAAVIRPSLEQPKPSDVGYRLGAARGVGVWTSAEDSLVILGPPRSGKGLHLVIPMIRDAPGAVVTTSTRPDNVEATLRVRDELGPVAVFDPQGLATRHTPGLRWSLVRGCEQAQTAMLRARALAADSADGIENGGFWKAQTEAALRAFLHAAALDGRDAQHLYRWSLDPAKAHEAVQILSASPRAATGWSDGLEAIINGDPRTRDNAWAQIRAALGALADPRVLAAVTPDARGGLDPTDFLTRSGTIYLLGSAAGASAAANVVAALIEDVVDVARGIAADAPHGRLDPPLGLILDEAANYALPSLPSLISEGGGNGITTVAVLQSLAQARARWGEHDGAAIWDAASVKVILGGGSNARDLQDLSVLFGERDDETVGWTRDGSGRRSTSTSVRRVPVLEANRLRTLPFGKALVLTRSMKPIAVDLEPWTRRS